MSRPRRGAAVRSDLPRIDYARKRPDLRLTDVARGLVWCVRPRPVSRSRADIASHWAGAADSVLACLSVRSGFDLLLSVAGWPPGSEVILSAVTIPHLATLVRAHGYVPVAVDVDAATMAVDPDALAAACTERTRAVVIAQLFGSRNDLTAVAQVARSRRLLLVEDGAQCFDPDAAEPGVADVVMYSFGLIKTATCAGGAVLLVRDHELRDRMTTLQQTYPGQAGDAYAAKLARAGLLVVLTHPSVYRWVVRAAHRRSGDFDAVLRSAGRGFSDAHLLADLRRQPCPALLTMLAHRLGPGGSGLERRRRAGARLSARLDPHVTHLGARGSAHTHWLFPVNSRSPDQLVRTGRDAGFDLTRGSSTLVCLDPSCPVADAAMRDVVYLPVYDYGRRSDPGSARALDRLAELVNAIEEGATGE